MKFTVKRSEWLRGRGGSESRLLKDGQRCCFGFVASQCGVPDNQLSGWGYLRHVAQWGAAQSLAGFMMSADNEAPWVRDGYVINDASNVPDARREVQLSELFAANGHELAFID